MYQIHADFREATGLQILPLHGTNNSRMTLTAPLTEFAAAGIPYVRVHDTGGAFGGHCYVDIPNVFPNFEADENAPASYRFEFTDAYFERLTEAGCKPFYRLGVTIENNWKIHAYNIYPPKSPEKWARICEHIIRHYNEGWANGFHYEIEYWEIWNEPENPPMWMGTQEEFFNLYKVSASHLRACFPSLKLGGFASCGFYAIDVPDCSEFYRKFVPWALNFLDFVAAEKLPLDFFSWHLYTEDPEQLGRHARFARKILDERGFRKTESICDEWNFVSPDAANRWDLMKEAVGAACVGSCFIVMQQNRVDKAMYYVGTPNSSYCGLYYFPSLRPAKPLYMFLAFNELYKLEHEIACQVNGEKFYALAAANSEQAALLVINNSPDTRQLHFDLKNAPAFPSVYLLDQQNLLNPVAFNGKDFPMPPYGVLLLTCNLSFHPDLSTTAQTRAANGIETGKKTNK